MMQEICTYSYSSSFSQAKGSARLARVPPPCNHASYRRISSRKVDTFSFDIALIHLVLPSSSAVSRYPKYEPMSGKARSKELTSPGNSLRQEATKSLISLLPSVSPKRGGLTLVMRLMTLK